ncbi:MAG: hypothetical protein R3C97_00475 [Geminicoccaceae bacterium]
MNDRPGDKNYLPPFEAFYIQSMLFNADSAARSIEYVNAILSVIHENEPDDPVSAIPVNPLITNLQNIILQSAALSRFFWPVRKKHEWRGVQLRSIFNLTEKVLLDQENYEIPLNILMNDLMNISKDR